MRSPWKFILAPKKKSKKLRGQSKISERHTCQQDFVWNHLFSLWQQNRKHRKATFFSLSFSTVVRLIWTNWGRKKTCQSIWRLTPQLQNSLCTFLLEILLQSMPFINKKQCPLCERKKGCLQKKNIVWLVLCQGEKRLPSVIWCHRNVCYPGLRCQRQYYQKIAKGQKQNMFCQ